MCSTCGCKKAESFDADSKVYIIEDAEGTKSEMSFKELFDYLNKETYDKYFLTKKERDDYFEKNYRYDAEQDMSKDIFSNMRDAKKRAKELGTNKIHSHKINGDKIYMPFKTHKEYTQKMRAEGSDNRAFSLFLYAAGGIFYGFFSQDIINFIKEKMG